MPEETQTPEEEKPKKKVVRKKTVSKADVDLALGKRVREAIEKGYVVCLRDGGGFVVEVIDEV